MDNTTNGTMGGSNMGMNNLNGEKKAVGPVIGLVIILIIIILGGIYFWTSRTTYAPIQDDDSTENQEVGSVSTEAILDQNSSDEPDSIEADLSSFNESDINNLDSGL